MVSKIYAFWSAIIMANLYNAFDNEPMLYTFSILIILLILTDLDCSKDDLLQSFWVWLIIGNIYTITNLPGHALIFYLTGSVVLAFNYDTTLLQSKKTPK